MQHYTKTRILALSSWILLFSVHLVHAQLTDETQTFPHVPGSAIAKSLEEQIGSGQGDSLTPGSSVYLIKRDPARSIRRGRQLFQRKFTTDQGQGPRVNTDSTGDIRANPGLGAGLADACATCHGRPRGSAGFGGDVATRPDSRDAPHLFGLGLVEQLADEMTRDLRAIRTQTLADAAGFPGLQAQVVSFPPIAGNVLIFVPTQSNGNNAIASIAEILLLGPDGEPLDVQLNAYALSQQSRKGGAKTIDGNPNTHWRSDPADGPIYSPNVALYLQWADPVEIGGLVYLPRQDGKTKGNITEFFIDIAVDSRRSSDWTRARGSLFTGTRTISFGSGTGGKVTRELVTKGISFGVISASADGSLDTTRVEGVDQDLRVKPFFHQGETVSIREFLIGAFKAEMGLEAWDPILCAATDPNSQQQMTSPAGFVFDPTSDDFERPPVCSPNDDGDGDGVLAEIDPALVDHMEFYLLNYFKPGRYKVTTRAKRGLALMDRIGCTNCHVQNLTIDSDRRVADVETRYDPKRGIFNQLFASAATLFEPFDDGQALPQLLPAGEPFVVENFFSDLKRHDLGPTFHERNYDGSMTTQFVTEPLWGVGSTAPYGHDGRSINLDAVIRRHDGEAQVAKQAYVALRDNDQRKIQEYLQTLVLFPPDDTASDLNAGNPGTNNPQNPSEHGSINLGALFQIDGEGPE